MSNEKRTIKAQEPVRAFENPFGDVSEEQAQGKALADQFYLHGYSDKRHERDLDMRAGEKPKPLTHRFQFVSVEDRAGRPVGEKQLEYRRLGYRPVQYDELKNFGIDPERSAAVKHKADGTVRVGSQMLMVVDAGTAAYHFQHQREETELQRKRFVEGRMERAADNYNARTGRTEATGGTKAFNEEKVTRSASPFDIE